MTDGPNRTILSAQRVVLPEDPLAFIVCSLTMSEKASALEFLRACKRDLHERFHVREMGLFGSIVKGEAGPLSDIDILVEFEKGADLFTLSELGAFLEDRLGRRVDIIPKRKVRPELREAILSEAVPV